MVEPCWFGRRKYKWRYKKRLTYRNEWFTLLFNPIEELKLLVSKIEAKTPTDIEDYLQEQSEYYQKNGIHDRMHIGKDGDWKDQEIAEWLLSMYVGIVDRGRKEESQYNHFVKWIKYVNHYIINKKEPN